MGSVPPNVNRHASPHKDGWFTRDIGPEFDIRAPGIYEWRIEGLGIYVGLTEQKLRTRIRAYRNNVRRHLAGSDYHGQAGGKYRVIHEAMKQAREEGRTVTVTVLQNCEKDLALLMLCEGEWIAKRRCEEAAGGPKVLNQTHFCSCTASRCRFA